MNLLKLADNMLDHARLLSGRTASTTAARACTLPASFVPVHLCLKPFTRRNSSRLRAFEDDPNSMPAEREQPEPAKKQGLATQQKQQRRPTKQKNSYNLELQETDPMCVDLSSGI
eukprot:scaffold20966_cov19-Tisochrysis_lutea.AAC.5